MRLAFSRPTAHPPPVVGADSISARGALFRRGVRRDEGIPPYGRRVSVAIPVGPNIKIVRRGGIYCARRRVSEANRRAAAALRPEIPPAGVRATAGFPGRCKHRPLQGLRQREVGIFPAGRAPAAGRRGGIHPAAGPCSAANRADMESAPTKVCYNAGAAVSRSARRHPRFVGEGHGPPAKPCATAISRFAAAFSPSRRAGVHARRTLAISKIGTLRRRRVRRMRAPRPTAARVAVAIPVGSKHKNCS